MTRHCSKAKYMQSRSLGAPGMQGPADLLFDCLLDWLIDWLIEWSPLLIFWLIPWLFASFVVWYPSKVFLSPLLCCKLLSHHYSVRWMFFFCVVFFIYLFVRWLIFCVTIYTDARVLLAWMSQWKCYEGQEIFWRKWRMPKIEFILSSTSTWKVPVQMKFHQNLIPSKWIFFYFWSLLRELGFLSLTFFCLLLLSLQKISLHLFLWCLCTFRFTYNLVLHENHSSYATSKWKMFFIDI